MNRQQRRTQDKQWKLGMVDLRTVVMPHQMTIEECRDIALYRLGLNATQTGHPFHHLTANGAVVDSDPTLEYLLGRLPEEECKDLRKRYGNLVTCNVKPAIAVNRTYYGRDPYAKQA